MQLGGESGAPLGIVVKNDLALGHYKCTYVFLVLIAFHIRFGPRCFLLRIDDGPSKKVKSESWQPFSQQAK